MTLRILVLLQHLKITCIRPISFASIFQPGEGADFVNVNESLMEWVEQLSERRTAPIVPGLARFGPHRL